MPVTSNSKSGASELGLGGGPSKTDSKKGG